ncbi:MAG: helix-turn-helix domain-containing protein [Nocardiopsaceae bacterium]|nr:helix-turn-helix domain-containing protein [Nocardiopsaceae bacterium]
MSVPPAPGSPALELTLERLLQERPFRHARVLRGADLLGRQVRWCHALADVISDDGGDLAAVMVLADAGELGPPQWDYLAGSGCAAVLLRSAAPRDPLPPPRDPAPPPSADGLVVIEVPESVRRRTVVELVATLSLAYQAHVLRYGQRVHNSLAQLLHRGAGITALCSRLARLSDCSAAIVGNDLHLLAFDPGPGGLDPHAVTTALKGAEGRLGELAAGPHGPHSVAVVDLQVRDRRLACMAGAIKLVEQRDGWVMLLDDATDVTDHDLAEHRAAVEQAVTIVGTELLRLRGLEQAEERARGNFVHALLHSLFSSHADLVARASYYGFDAGGRYGVVAARTAGPVTRDEAPSRLADLAGEAARLLASPHGQTLASATGDVIAIVRPVSAARRGQQDPAMSELRDYAAALDRRLAQRTGRPALVAFGRPVTGAEAIVESYREARVALELRQRLHLTGVCGFTDLRVDSVLLDLAQRDEGQRFAAEILDPLRTERDGGLVEVARVYAEAGGNVNEAARRLSVHRNTMLYKLERITRLLQRNIRDPDTQFTIWLALRLNDLDETARRVNRDLRAG